MAAIDRKTAIVRNDIHDDFYASMEIESCLILHAKEKSAASAGEGNPGG